MLSSSRPLTWNFKKADWETWNGEINKTIQKSDYYNSSNVKEKCLIFYNALMTENNPTKIKLSKTPDRIYPEPKQPWWTEECRRGVAKSRKARNLCDPSKGGVNCDSNRAAWKEKENEKKRIIITQRKHQ